MKRKWTMLALAWACMLQLLLAGGSPAHGAAAEANAFAVKGYKIIKGNTSQIAEGTEVTLQLTVENGSKDTYKPLTVQIEDSSAFYGKNSNIIDIPVEAQGKASFTVDLPVVYSGKGTQLTVSFGYKAGDSPASGSRQSLTVTQASPTAPEPTAAPTAPPLDTAKFAPKLVITGSDAIPTVTAGDTLALTLPVKNTAAHSAKDVTLVLEPEDKAKIPYEPNMINLTRSYDQFLGGETKALAFNLKIKADTPSGVYALKLSGQYTNAFGDPFTSSESLYVKVVNNATPIGLSLSGFSSLPAQAVPGGKLKLNVRLSNDGTTEARDVRLTLTGLKSDAFALDGDTGTRRIARFSGATAQDAVFSLTVAQNIAGGSQPLGVKLDYKDETGTAVSEEIPVFIPVKRAEEASAAAVSIEALHSPAGILSPKDTFDISFKVTNSGGVKAQNVKVAVTADKELVPKSLSNVIIQSLGPGQSKALSFTMAVAPDAATKTYPITIAVDYDVMQAGQPVKTSLLQYAGVYVEGAAAPGEPGKTVPRIIVNQYGVNPKQALAGEPVRLDLSFLNTSAKMNVSNIKLTAVSEDGVFTVDGSNTVFVDSIPVRGTAQASFTLLPKADAEPKSYALSLNFEYEDAKGNPYTSKETVSIPVRQSERLSAGEVSVLGEAFPQQPVPLSMEFYNMGKSILYNLMVSVEGDFQKTNGSYYVGNFASGRSDTFEPSIMPSAPGELSGTVVFSYEDAAGNKSEVRKPFTVQVAEMPAPPEMPTDQPLAGPEGEGSKLRPYLYVGIPALAVVLAAAGFMVLRARRRKRKEMELDDDF